MLTPVRELLFRGEEPEPGFGAYGFLLMRRSGAMSAARSNHVCAASWRHASSLEGIESAPDAPSRPEIAPTFWPIRAKKSDFRFAAVDPCLDLLRSYDFERATNKLSAIDGAAARAGFRLNLMISEGPILIAMPTLHAPATLSSRKELLVLDLSRFSESVLDKAFDLWFSKIRRGPYAWNHLELRQYFLENAQIAEDFLHFVSGSPLIRTLLELK
jgi:hypothetical protein